MCDYSFVRRYDVINSKGNRFYVFSRLDPYEEFPKRFPSVTVLESPFLLSILTPLEYLKAVKRMERR